MVGEAIPLLFIMERNVRLMGAALRITTSDKDKVIQTFAIDFDAVESIEYLSYHKKRDGNNEGGSDVQDHIKIVTKTSKCITIPLREKNDFFLMHQKLNVVLRTMDVTEFVTTYTNCVIGFKKEPSSIDDSKKP